MARNPGLILKEMKIPQENPSKKRKLLECTGCSVIVQGV
jgi:hypothetical protein